MITAAGQMDQPTAIAQRPLRALVRDGLPLLVIATALDFSFALFVMVIQAYLPDTIGGSDRTPGLALGLYGATRVVLQLPGGLLARRIGAARLAVLGAGLAALATLLLAVATNVPQVYLLTLLAGSGTALVWPAVYLLAGDETTDQRGALLSLLTFCALAGMGAGIILGALLVDTVPSRAIIPLMAIVLGSAALGGIVAGRRIEAKQMLQRSGDRTWERGRPARMVGDRDRGAGETPALPGAEQRHEHNRSRRTLLTLTPALALQAIGLSMLLPLLRQYAREQLGLELRDLILLGVPAGLAAVATFVPAGRLADRIGRGPVVAAGAAAAGLGVFLLAAAESRLLFAIGAIPLAAGYAASAPALGAWITDLTDDAGRNVGLALTIQGIALAIGPALTALLIAGHGPALPMRVAAAMWLAAALCAAATAFLFRRVHMRAFWQPDEG